jgi:hypothetical protein
MIIVRTIFELNEMYSLGPGYIIKNINELNLIKEDYDERRSDIRSKGSLYLTNLDKQEINDLDSQLYYLEVNIKTLVDALMLHESKLFEKRSLTLNELGLFALN